jgi:beta-glucosidase
MDAYDIRWFLDPIFGNGYPQEALNRFNMQPPIEDGDLEIISEPMDFLGVNFYLRQVVRANKESDFFGVDGVDTPGTPTTGMGWEINPEALADLLIRVNHDYKVPEYFITENGSAWDDDEIDGSVNDINRIDYLEKHLSAMEVAIDKGVPIRGYFAWSLLDNFEWTHGYSKRFGLVYINFQNQSRIIKESGKWYARRIQINSN